MPKDEFTPQQHAAARQAWLEKYADVPGPRYVLTLEEDARIKDGVHYDREVPLALGTKYPERRTSGVMAPMPAAPERPELRPTEVLKREWLTVEESNARTTLGKHARTLQERNWDVKVGHSTYYSGDKYYDSSKRVAPGSVKQHYWLDCAGDRFGRLTVNADGATLNGKKIDKEEWEELING